MTKLLSIIGSYAVFVFLVTQEFVKIGKVEWVLGIAQDRELLLDCLLTAMYYELLAVGGVIIAIIIGCAMTQALIVAWEIIKSLWQFGTLLRRQGGNHEK